jgi:hypothetical protein
VKSELDWESLIIPLTQSQITRAVSHPGWQALRTSLHGTSLEYRYNQLCWWIVECEPNSQEEQERRVQVANYINALKRGGMIRG